MDSNKTPLDQIGEILTGQLLTRTLSEEETKLLRRRERDLARKKNKKLVLAEGIEPSTSALQERCYYQLSYASKSND